MNIVNTHVQVNKLITVYNYRKSKHVSLTREKYMYTEYRYNPCKDMFDWSLI